MSAPPRFSTLAQARDALSKLRSTSQAKSPSRGPALPQVLVHCAQSIEYSLSGYPAMKPAIVRATLGRLVMGMFLRRGMMKHNLAAPVPGAPPVSGESDVEAAWTRLFAALDRFEALTEAPRDHFLYGGATKDQYARIHAMHLADHLSAFI